MKFNFKWAAGRQATGPLQKDEDNTIFGFIFAHLEVFLLIGMGFMIYALFNTFTQFVADHALFIHEPDRWSFARTLIFGLMGVEVLLALATSYFRRRSEWAKSILVTLVSFIITYYNHETIAEIFRTLPAASEAVCLKLMLTNWLIFGLGEIVSLLMNSKGRALDPPPTARPAQDAPPSWLPDLLRELQGQGVGMGTNPAASGPVGASTLSGPVSLSLDPAPMASADTDEHLDNSGNPPIGFRLSPKEEAPRRFPPAGKLPPRGPSLDYKRMGELADMGLRTKEIAIMMHCSEASVRRFKSKYWKK